MWRCTLLAALFLFFLLWSADRFFFSLFFLQLRVSFRIKGREVSIFFFLSIIDVKTIFLFIFLFEYLPVFGEQLARMISSVEERRILYGILYGMDFQPSLVDNKRKTMELNLRPMRKIWKSSNYYTLWRKLGEGRRRKRSTIWQISGRKRIVDWLRVALFMTISRSSRQRDELGFDEKEHQEGNEGKEGREKKGKNKRENSRGRKCSYFDRKEGKKKGKKKNVQSTEIFHKNYFPFNYRSIPLLIEDRFP